MSALSPRAQRLLAMAERYEVVRDRAALSRRLRACGRPVLDVALDFQERYGGLSWGPYGHSCNLGVVFRRPTADPASHPLGERERTMVPIGTVAGSGDSDDAYLDASGEVFTAYGSRSASVEKYLEQAAMRELAPWPRRIDVSLRPSLGAPLAAALGLSPVAEANDVYQQWWRSEAVELCQVLLRSSPASNADHAQMGSVAEAARVCAVAASLDPDVGVSVHFADGVDYVYVSREEGARLVTVDAWSAVPGARRYPLGTMWDDVEGAVWMVPTETGGVVIHTYRVDAQGAVSAVYRLDERGEAGWLVTS